jgi:hypothetical protein
VLPLAPGRSRIRRFDFVAARGARRTAPRRRDSWQRRADAALREQVARAESTQAGLMGTPEDSADSGPLAPALAQFRAGVAALLHALPQDPGRR